VSRLQTRRVDDDPTEIIPEGSKGESAVKAAAALKTNDSYVKAVSVKKLAAFFFGE
jgi:hypothetical protein